MSWRRESTGQIEDLDGNGPVNADDEACLCLVVRRYAGDAQPHLYRVDQVHDPAVEFLIPGGARMALPGTASPGAAR